MRTILALLSLLFCISLRAQTYGNAVAVASPFLSQLKCTTSKQNSIMASFKQTKVVRMMNGPQVSHRNFYFVRNGQKICLDYVSPANNRIVISNGQFIITTGSKKNTFNASQNPALAQMSEMITACLTGDFSSLANSMSTTYFETADDFTMVMAPSSNRVKRYVKEIVLSFSKADMTLNTMKLTEGNGDSQMYEYSDKHINASIDNSIFE